jgi:ABC-type polysaccharide/polyol phosphate transport system ATPase subunit
MTARWPRAAEEPAECLIEVDGVSKKYCRDFRRSLRYAVRDIVSGFLPRQEPNVLRKDEFWAVKDVSFTLRRGDSLGLIGHNGAGKSTLLKMLTGQRILTTGKVIVRGRVVALTELGLGFDPVLTGRENAYVNASVLGVPRSQLEPTIDAIIEFAGLREFIDSSVQTYSSGMKARLGFSVAVHLDPDILIVDEVLAVGDLAFRRKCVKHIQGFLDRGGSMLLVAHEPFLIQTICNRCLVIEKGRVIFDGPSVEGVDLHFQVGRAALFESVAGTDRIRITPQAAVDLQAPPASEPTDEQPILVNGFEVHPEGNLSLVTGCSALVTLRCRSLIEAEVHWGFTICTADLLTSISTCGSGLGGRRVTVRPGENEFRCRIPNLPLRPDVYAVRGGISDSSGISMALLGYQDTPSFFTVKSAQADRTSNLQASLNDLVAIYAEWLD